MNRTRLIVGLLCLCCFVDLTLGGMQRRARPGVSRGESGPVRSPGVALDDRTAASPAVAHAPEPSPRAARTPIAIQNGVGARRGADALRAGMASEHVAAEQALIEEPLQVSPPPSTATVVGPHAAGTAAPPMAEAPASEPHAASAAVTASSDRHVMAAAASLPVLDVGPALPGMPQEIVLGRTFEVDCTTPARDIPTQRINFVDYLRNVLPNEWLATWPAASLDAGAIAAKQFAWYTVAQRKWRSRGYPFDLVDNTCDQLYRDGSADARTDAAFQRTWGLLLLRDGHVIETEYRDTETTCGERLDCMGQVESARLAAEGQSVTEILARYYGAAGTALHDSDGRLPARLPPVPPAPRLRRPATPTTTAVPSPTNTATPAPTATATPTSTTTPASPTASPTATADAHEPAPDAAPSETPLAELPTETPDETAPPTPAAPSPAATPTSLPAVQFPDLIGLGENQARAALAKLGIRTVIVDYQGRDRLGDRWDQVPPYAVVSHRPAAGTLVAPETLVVLGIRAP